MTATRDEADRIERWSREHERHMIVKAIEREAATWQPDSQVYARKITEAIAALPVLVLPKRKAAKR